MLIDTEIQQENVHQSLKFENTGMWHYSKEFYVFWLGGSTFSIMRQSFSVELWKFAFQVTIANNMVMWHIF